MASILRQHQTQLNVLAMQSKSAMKPVIKKRSIINNMIDFLHQDAL
jgi:hypothetical protein